MSLPSVMPSAIQYPNEQPDDSAQPGKGRTNTDAANEEASAHELHTSCTRAAWLSSRRARTDPNPSQTDPNPSTEDVSLLHRYEGTRGGREQMARTLVQRDVRVEDAVKLLGAAAGQDAVEVLGHLRATLQPCKHNVLCWTSL